MKLTKNEINVNLIKEKNFNKLLKVNRLFLLKLVKGYTSDQYLIKELMQMATIGLWEAYQRFDLNANNNFITYAQFWINKYIKDWLIHYGYTVYTPNYSKELRQPIISMDKSYGEDDEHLSQKIAFVDDYVDEREAIIFDIINTKLSGEDRELILQYGDLNQTELANKLNCSKQNIQQKLNRITNKIKKYYDEIINE